MIRAGLVDEVNKSSGEWLFVDVGFSANSRSCGCLLGERDPVEMTFSKLLIYAQEIVSKGSSPLNLLIEAPLSVAFNASGNPTGRSIERRDSETRYWYIGLGCGVLMSAMYMLRHLEEANPLREVRLFEGFASFKPKGSRSSHTDDVCSLRKIVWEPDQHPGAVVPPEMLRILQSDVIFSAFKVAGMDFGVPTVVIVNH